MVHLYLSQTLISVYIIFRTEYALHSRIIVTSQTPFPLDVTFRAHQDTATLQ